VSFNKCSMKLPARISEVMSIFYDVFGAVSEGPSSGLLGALLGDHAGGIRLTPKGVGFPFA